MSKRHVRAYPKEFREQVVKLALSSGRRPRKIAEEFEISVDSVRRWVRQAQLDSGERKDGLTTPEREKFRKLRRDIRRVLVRLGDRFDSFRVFEFMRSYQGSYPVAMMCRVLGKCPRKRRHFKRRAQPPVRRLGAGRERPRSRASSGKSLRTEAAHSSPRGLCHSSRRHSSRANSARECEVLSSSLRNHRTMVGFSMRRPTRTTVVPHGQLSIC